MNKEQELKKQIEELQKDADKLKGYLHRLKQGFNLNSIDNKEYVELIKRCDTQQSIFGYDFRQKLELLKSELKGRQEKEKEILEVIDKELKWTTHSVINGKAPECCKEAYKEGEKIGYDNALNKLNNVKQKIKEQTQNDK